jgi:hypothetical protein
MQVYKGLDLMTNKVTEQEKEGIQHHLMDFVSPVLKREADGSFIQGEYSVPEFQRDALRVVRLSSSTQLDFTHDERSRLMIFTPETRFPSLLEERTTISNRSFGINS